MPQEGELQINTRRVTEGVQICVFNSGPYIPPEEMAHLFEPFYTTKETGSGLGLALSYQIMKSHKGTLVVHSGQECAGLQDEGRKA